MPPAPVHALFFAAVPPSAVRAQMATLWQCHGTGARFRGNTLHLSVHGVGRLAVIDPVLLRRLRQVAAVLRVAPFPLCLDRLMAFNGRSGARPLVLTTDRACPRLDALAAEVRAACLAADLPTRGNTKVTPHVTLAYGPGLARARPLDESIRWTIDEIVLIDSLQGQERHVPLGRWHLPEGREQPALPF